jgi:hypothetical protein
MILCPPVRRSLGMRHLAKCVRRGSLVIVFRGRGRRELAAQREWLLVLVLGRWFFPHLLVPHLREMGGEVQGLKVASFAC